MDRLSIAKARRELSRVVNQVAFGKMPVVLTSRGRPKAVLVGHEEYLRLVGAPHQSLIRLGGRWRGTPPISYEEMREVRAQAWRRLG